MKIVQGDLIKLACEGHFDVIVHGCNCFHMMGSGIAKSIRAAFPEAFAADLETIRGYEGKLGHLSSSLVKRNGHHFVVVNAYTQFNGGANVDYDAVRSAMNDVKKCFAGQRIGYPKIGAGIGGGDWGILSRIIDGALAGEDHTLVEWVP